MGAARGALVLMVFACSKPKHAPAPPPPPIDDKPRVLHDEAELAAYVAAFPADQYKIAHIDSNDTDFYVDTTKDVIKGALSRGVQWEKDHIPWFEKCVHEGDYVLDVGAHIGTHAIDLSRIVGDAGHVYAFEPQKKIYRELTKNLELNHIKNVTPMRFAIGDGEPQIVHMTPAAHNNEGGTSVGEGGDAVELRALDSFGLPRIAFIKIDVEGYEDHVLDGARNLIAANHPAIIVEIQAQKSEADAEVKAKSDATKAKIEALGYSLQYIGGSDYLAVSKDPAAAARCR